MNHACLRLALPVVAALLAACTTDRDDASLPLREVGEFSVSGAMEPPTRWWTVFNDPRLDALIEGTLDQNFTLQAAWERLQAAQALARRAGADRWPELDASGGLDYRRGSATSNAGPTYRAGLEASFEIDLWGRINAQSEAEALRASATYADYQTAALSLSAEVTRAWYQLAEAQLQLNLLAEQAETNRIVLELLRSRFSAGLIRSADVLRQRQLVESTLEQIVVVRTRRGITEHQLAALQGLAPQDVASSLAPRLPELPPLPRVGLPVGLVQRRPDVQAAYLDLQAANRDLAAAVSNQFPRINLNAALTSSAEEPGSLFRSWLTSLGGSITAPLFDGGARRAEVARTEAIERQRLAEYGDTVLNAFVEVEDALLRERQQVERIESLDRQLELARNTYEQLRTQYLNGVIDYLGVLDALTDEQRLRRSLLSARLTLVEIRIALYRAVAGPFPTTREQTTLAAHD